MADLRIADAPEIDESEVQGGLKIPTGGFGNKAINMTTMANWVVKDKDLPSKGYVDTAVAQGNQGLAGHVANKNNPHEVTKDQVGLGNVDNTADADKPISNATSAALNLKADKTQLQGLATTTQLDAKADKTQLDLKADKSTTYTKTEVDGAVDDLYQSLEDNFIANGAALPYDPQVTYNDGAIVVDNGALKKVEGGNLVNAVDAESVSVGDSTLDVFARDYSSVFVLSSETYTGDFKAAIQDALNKHSSVLIRGEHEIDVSDGVFVKPNSGTQIVFEPSAKITVLPTTLDRYYVFDMRGTKDVTILYPNIVGDKYTHLGTTGQWGYGIFVSECENIKIVEPNISKMWGDGITVFKAKNTIIDKPILTDNRRQGISITGDCDSLDIYYPQISDTSGHPPAYGIDIECDWAGASIKGVRIHNPIFKNNGENGSSFTGFCISTWRAGVPETGTEILDTEIEVELYNPKFYGDGLIVSAYIDQVKGFCKVYNPEFHETKTSAINILNHQSANFFTEIIKPKFYDCVTQTSSIYTNPITIECGNDASQTNGTRNVKIISPEFYASENAAHKTVAIRNITKSTYTDDLENVSITDAKFFGFSQMLSFINGTGIPNTPHPSFKFSVSSESERTTYSTNNAITKNLDNTNVKYVQATVSASYYLWDELPVSNLEYSFKNDSTSDAAQLSLFFGTRDLLSPKIVNGLSDNKQVSNLILEKGSEVKLKKTSANRFEIVSQVGRVKTNLEVPTTTVFDPPSIAAKTTEVTTVTLQGVAVGQPVIAAFSRYNAGIKINAVVSEANTVTVSFENTTDAAIDLLSGTLTVKAI